MLINIIRTFQKKQRRSSHHYRGEINTKIINSGKKKKRSVDFQTVKTTRKVYWVQTKVTKRENNKIRDKVNKDEFKNNKENKTNET